MLERGFIKISRSEREALVFLRPDRVTPVTMAGAVDALARLGQEWTILWPLTPGSPVEWFRSYTRAIHRIRTLMEEAGRLPPCPDYDDILAEALRFEAASALPVVKYRVIGDIA
jgi:hypothetical protein